MRAALDANALFSALVSPSGTPNEIYRAWRSGRSELATPHEQLDEIRRASRYPKLKAVVPNAGIGALANIMKRGPVLGRLDLRDTGEAKDRGDVFLLAMAAEGGADYLVTGDKRAGLLELARIGRIVTPYIFYAEALS